MRQLSIKNYGKSASSLLLEERPRPEPKDDEVLIRIISASVNPVDFKMVNGQFKYITKVKLPIPFGYDYSGRVVELGKNVKGFEVGDKVIGCMAAGSPGAFAEYAVSGTEQLTHAARNMPLEEQAGLCLAGMTVLQCFDKIALKHSDHILIQAGSGGVGHLAIQIAKRIGARVTATCSSRNEDWVYGLGADHVICYDKDNYLNYPGQFDVVLDSLGGKHSKRVLRCLKEGGRMVRITGGMDRETALRLGVPRLFRPLLQLQLWPLLRACRKRSVSYAYVLMQSNRKDLDRLVHLVDEQGLKVHIEERYTLANGIAALVRQETGRVRGKLLILTDD